MDKGRASKIGKIRKSLSIPTGGKHFEEFGVHLLDYLYTKLVTGEERNNKRVSHLFYTQELPHLSFIHPHILSLWIHSVSF